MNKEFVTKKQAHALKELGFDELCIAADYYSDGEILIEYADEGITNKELDEITDELNEDAVKNRDKLLNYDATIPLYQQAFRWFREKHAMHHGIGFNGSWYYDIDSMKNCDEAVYEVAHKWDMETYEEAESACLDKLIEIVKNK